jgi:L-asparagine transporter-like permease
MAPAFFNSVDKADAAVDDVVIVARCSSYSTEMYAYTRLIIEKQSEIRENLHLKNLS